MTEPTPQPPSPGPRPGPPVPRPGPPPATTSGPETAESDAVRDERATARVDDVLADLADLDGAPLDEHHDRLAAAHEKLHGLLDEHRQG
ncbi:hypothetical protein ACQBAR_10510 [Propionibacteriaceae bacterium Y1685]|uniref:hypothetical protein n=1 Tax=Microlunatus sp. Y1700 TaxID=3418487 RepID=UPI003B7EBCC5